MQHKKVIENIELEIKRIERLINEYEVLLKKVKVQHPDFIELGSLAMLLHSFYNGLENIFSRIARKIDEKMPQGEGWHKELLEQMARQTKKRKQVVLSNNICKDLEEYLGFRHFSIHAYAFDLDWELMKELVEKLNDVKERVLGEIRLFITRRRLGVKP
ncbi:MAG: hypothetical protein QME42_04985 [bacterium]|nr:hypothetical protein [bacterium]